MKLVILLNKAKYIKRWRGPDGKWRYQYELPTGRGRGRKVTTTSPKAPRKLERIKARFGRKEPGMGHAKPITSKEDLETVLTQTTVCMISAGRNPNRTSDGGLTDKQIKKRTSRLKADLIRLGYVFTPTKGKYGQPEDSVIVMTHDANRQELVNLGRKYKQDTVLFVDNGKSEMIQTTGENSGDVVMEGTGHEYVPEADNFYTDIDVGGETLRFTMLLNDVAKAIFRWMMTLAKGR